MTLPDSNHPGWADAIKTGKARNYQYLATKILVGRLSSNYQLEPTPEKMKQSIDELRNFFQKNMQVPKVQDDLKRAFGERI